MSDLKWNEMLEFSSIDWRRDINVIFDRKQQKTNPSRKKHRHRHKKIKNTRKKKRDQVNRKKKYENDDVENDQYFGGSIYNIQTTQNLPYIVYNNYILPFISFLYFSLLNSILRDILRKEKEN